MAWDWNTTGNMYNTGVVPTDESQQARNSSNELSWDHQLFACFCESVVLALFCLACHPPSLHSNSTDGDSDTK